MSAPRDRQGSLELDYGDDAADMDYDQWSAAQLAASTQQQQDTKPNVASTATATKSTSSAAPPTQAAPAAAPSSSSSLPPRPAGNGLPANPLTGQRPPIASTSSNSNASGSGAAEGGGRAGSQGGAGAGYVPGDRLAQTAVFLGELHWWTSDRDVVELTQLAGVHGVSIKDVSFAEHKVNGKSKGVCYVECHSTDNAQRVKSYVENNEFQMKKLTATLAPGGTGNAPFRTLPKEPSRVGNPPPVPSGQVRIGHLTVRTPRPATTAYHEPHPGQNRRDQPPGTGPGAQLGGIRLGGVMPAPGTGGGPQHQQNKGGGHFNPMHQQQGPPAMHMGMGLPMNPMLAAGGGGAGGGGAGGPNGVFNPAFLSATRGGAGSNQQQQQPQGGFGFDPSAAFGMGMPNFGMGGMMPDFSQMGMMNMNMMGMGGMGMGMGAFGGGPFGGGMSPFGGGGGGISPMSGGGNGMDGAGSGEYEPGPKKRTRTD
ncbi:hypothetical protein JCM10908_003936 [Rhodotorula pacifica]|uniref:RNA-binding protein n=1 Tax=Rhodotorula pacifica TaxID=1495444 RepID=UPI0031807C90